MWKFWLFTDLHLTLYQKDLKMCQNDLEALFEHDKTILKVFKKAWKCEGIAIGPIPSFPWYFDFSGTT